MNQHGVSSKEGPFPYQEIMNINKRMPHPISLIGEPGQENLEEGITVLTQANGTSLL